MSIDPDIMTYTLFGSKKSNLFFLNNFKFIISMNSFYLYNGNLLKNDIYLMVLRICANYLSSHLGLSFSPTYTFLSKASK